MAKTKIKEVSFHEPVYQCDISLLYGGDVPELISFIYERHGDAQKYSFGEKFDWEEHADTTDAYQFHIVAPLGKGERFYIWIYAKTMYLLAHEIFHLTGDVLHDRGMKYSMESEEAFAYYHGYLFQEIFKLLKGRI